MEESKGKTSKKPKTLSFSSSQSLKLKITCPTNSLLFASVFLYIVVSPLHTCKHTIGLHLGQPLMLSRLSLFHAVICTVHTGPTCTGICTRDKTDQPLCPLLTCDCHALEAFHLSYAFVLLWIVCFVLFCVSWHKWAPSGSRIRRVGLQIFNGISLWLNPSLLSMSSTHRLSHLWVMMPKSFDILRSNPMAEFTIGSCSITLAPPDY